MPKQAQAQMDGVINPQNYNMQLPVLPWAITLLINNETIPKVHWKYICTARQILKYV